MKRCGNFYCLLMYERMKLKTMQGSLFIIWHGGEWTLKSKDRSHFECQKISYLESQILKWGRNVKHSNGLLFLCVFLCNNLSKEIKYLQNKQDCTYIFESVVCTGNIVACSNLKKIFCQSNSTLLLTRPFYIFFSFIQSK